MAGKSIWDGSPIGRGNRLKIYQVWVRVPLVLPNIMQPYKQLLFDFAVNPPVKFHIQRGKKLPVEIWEYNNILGAVERGDYVVLTLEDKSAFIPKAWVVKVEQ